MLSCIKHCPFGGKPPYIFVGSLRLTISQVQSQHGRQPGCPGEGQSTGPSTCGRKLGCSEASVAMGRDGLLTPRERCDSSRWSGIPFPPTAFSGRPLARQVKLQVALPWGAPVQWIHRARALGTCSSHIVPSCARTVTCLRWCPE